MALWRVETATSVKDPRETGDPAWLGCSVLAFTARFLGLHIALVGADPEVAASLRAIPGVRSVEPSRDLRYFDDRTDTHVVVTGGRVRGNEGATNQ